MKSFRSIRRRAWFLPGSGGVRIIVRHWVIVLVWVLLTGFAYQTGHDIFVRLSYLVLAVIVLSFFWGAYSVSTFQFERKLITAHAQVGRVAEESFLVHNTGRFPKIWIEIRDESELQSHRASRVLNALRAGVRWSWSVRTPCRRRGRYRLGPVTISTGDPFGLFIFQRRLPNTTSAITIYPATFDLPNFSPPLGQLPGGDALHRRSHQVTTNVAGTREYAPGDSFNRIHWPSTARADRLIVKEFELDPTADVWIFLDMERDVQAAQWWEETWDTRDLSPLWFAERGTRLPPSTEEYDVTIAASVAKYFLNGQRAVGFVAYGHQRETVQPDRGERQLKRLLDTLAVLRAEGRTPFDQMLAIEGARLARNTTLVAITPSTDTAWVRLAREIKRRGLRIIAVLTDVNSFGGAGDSRGVAADLMASGIPIYMVRAGDDLPAVLGR